MKCVMCDNQEDLPSINIIDNTTIAIYWLCTKCGESYWQFDYENSEK